jgi:hypothetical protein
MNLNKLRFSHFLQNINLKLSFYILFLIISGNCIAQNRNDESLDSKSYLKLMSSYLSNSIYYGRTDSLALPYFTPSLTYFNKSGFYVGGSLSIYTGIGKKRIDLYSIDLGYDFDLNDHLNVSIYANKSFYNSNSTAIKSDISSSAGANLSYDFSYLEINAGTYVLFSQKSDIGFNFGLSKAIEIGDSENGVALTPYFTTYFSTLHFYEGYNTRKSGRILARTFPNFQSSQSITVVNNPGLKLMDYEFSLNLDIEQEKWGGFIYPFLAIPRNPIYTTTSTTVKLINGTQYSTSNNSTPYSEKALKSRFFVEAGLYLKF